MINGDSSWHSHHPPRTQNVFLRWFRPFSENENGHGGQVRCYDNCPYLIGKNKARSLPSLPAGSCKWEEKTKALGMAEPALQCKQVWNIFSGFGYVLLTACHFFHAPQFLREGSVVSIKENK